MESREGGGSEKNELDIYKDWNPLLDENRSFLNNFSYDPRDPLSVITGTKGLTTENIPCKFYKPNSGRKTCGKFNCKYLHDEAVAVGKSTQDEKLAIPSILQEITLLTELPPKTLAADGVMNLGTVVSIVDPGDFYIIPHGDWSCACTKTSILVENEDNKAGVTNLFNLWEDLKNLTQVITEQDSTYSANQLVAVKIRNDTDPGKQWFRAVVLEDVLLGETFELPAVRLRLLDFGTYLVTTIDTIIPLPRKLLRYPQLGYRCAMNGISPITHRWSRRATDVFRILAHGQECIFEIKRTVMPGIERGDGVFEAIPHLVELSVKLNGKYVNVTHELGSQGLGLQSNPFPSRPSIFKSVSNPRALALLMAKEPTHSIPIDSQIPHHIFEREEGRLEKYLNRCWRFRPGTIIVGEAKPQTPSTQQQDTTDNSILEKAQTIETYQETKNRSYTGVTYLPHQKLTVSVPMEHWKAYTTSASKPTLSETDNDWRSSSSLPHPSSADTKLNSRKCYSNDSTQPATTHSKKGKQKWKTLDL